MGTEAISQSQIIRKNIEAIAEIQRKHVAARTPRERVSDLITQFSGSMAFVYFHVVWFGVWILLNINLIHLPYISEFDPFPFGLLTMVVSLEAIFLSTFVLISQNRMAGLSEKRAELDLQVNMLAEQKAAKTLELLEHVAQQLDAMSDRFNYQTDPEIQALKVSPEPQEVLQVMEEAVEEEAKEVKRKVRDAVKDITGEVEAVKDDVEEVGEQVKQVASDVQEVKEEVKMSA
jgi:uncharacterized membrane protein